MSEANWLRAVLWLAAIVGAHVAAAAEPTGAPTAQPAEAETDVSGLRKKPAADAGQSAQEKLGWPEGLNEARRRAQAENKPLLVRCGAAWCSWCARLAETMTTDKVQSELRRFTVVYVDVDQHPDEARALLVGPIPALRVLDRSGKVVASQDGFLEEEALVDWLAKSFEVASVERPAALAKSGPLTSQAVKELIESLASSAAVEREASIRRLMREPKTAAAPLVEAFLANEGQGVLARRLAALEILIEWGAPVASLDPWKPQTIGAEAGDRLTAWARDAVANLEEQHAQLTPAQLAAADREIARLVVADDTEAEAIVERLARFGAGLVPKVTAQVKDAATDQARQRLVALRLRLVASDELVLSWPGGLARLADPDPQVRHEAAEQLAQRATSADEALLLYLFSDLDPLVREISLRALQRVSLDAGSGALAKLLDDPEPNVRAAVLKQLAEQPSRGIAAEIAQYAKREQDPDLVVHAVRVLKAARSTSGLMDLLDHDSWQVRAEAAEALGSLAQGNYGGEEAADIYVALIGLLDDSDGFVVSRAVLGLEKVDLPSAVAPLAAAALKHPELASDVVKVLTHTPQMSIAAEPRLREFAVHEDPQVRAGAIAALAAADVEDVEKIVAGGLADADSSVRQATAEALLARFEKQFENPQFAGFAADEPDAPAAVNPLEAAIRGLFGALAAKPKPNDKKKGEAKAPGKQTSDEKSPVDAWLLEFYQGKHRPKWTAQMVAPLEKMLAAEAPRERLAARLALVPLGQAEPGTAEIGALVDSDPVLVGQASRALPWLLWPARVELLQQLVEHASGRRDAHQLVEVIQNLVKNRDHRAAQPLWQLLERTDIDAAAVSAIEFGLSALYQGTGQVSFGDSTLSKPIVEEITRYAETGTPWQKDVALALLLQNSAGDPESLARKILDDPQTDDAFRVDAFQLLMHSMPEKSAKEEAVAALKSGDRRTLKVALAYLARGTEGVQQLRDAVYVYSTRFSVSFSGQPSPIEAPPGLTEEMVRPLVDDDDPEVAACAGYLLATLGHADGLDALVRQWRKTSGRNSWTAPLYRAIAALDDESRVPILAEIYRQLSEWEMRDFYWTIRTMHGRAVLKLRKQIRDEVGMENLR